MEPRPKLRIPGQDLGNKQYDPTTKVDPQYAEQDDFTVQASIESRPGLSLTEVQVSVKNGTLYQDKLGTEWDDCYHDMVEVSYREWNKEILAEIDFTATDTVLYLLREQNLSISSVLQFLEENKTAMVSWELFEVLLKEGPWYDSDIFRICNLKYPEIIDDRFFLDKKNPSISMALVILDLDASRRTISPELQFYRDNRDLKDRGLVLTFQNLEHLHRSGIFSSIARLESFINSLNPGSIQQQKKVDQGAFDRAITFAASLSVNDPRSVEEVIHLLCVDSSDKNTTIMSAIQYIDETQMPLRPALQVFRMQVGDNAKYVRPFIEQYGGILDKILWERFVRHHGKSEREILIAEAQQSWENDVVTQDNANVFSANRVNQESGEIENERKRERVRLEKNLYRVVDIGQLFIFWKTGELPRAFSFGTRDTDVEPNTLLTYWSDAPINGLIYENALFETGPEYWEQDQPKYLEKGGMRFHFIPPSAVPKFSDPGVEIRIDEYYIGDRIDTTRCSKPHINTPLRRDVENVLLPYFKQLKNPSPFYKQVGSPGMIMRDILNTLYGDDPLLIEDEYVNDQHGVLRKKFFQELEDFCSWVLLQPRYSENDINSSYWDENSYSSVNYVEIDGRKVKILKMTDPDSWHSSPSYREEE